MPGEEWEHSDSTNQQQQQTATIKFDIKMYQPKERVSKENNKTHHFKKNLSCNRSFRLYITEEEEEVVADGEVKSVFTQWISKKQESDSVLGLDYPPPVIPKLEKHSREKPKKKPKFNGIIRKWRNNS